tara:strand:- start:41 stop:1000 length:960 start_codon:yes stop_codon:yes gene_type:complete
MSNDVIQHSNLTSMMLDSNVIDSYKDMAKLMAQSQVSLPSHLQNKPADCLAIVFQAAQWRMNPFVVAQKTHVINGVLGYEAQLVNAVVSSSTAIDGRFKYEYKGERADWKPKMSKENRGGKDFWKVNFSANAAVRVGAVLFGDDDVTWGEWLYPCDQTVFNSPLWKTNAKQQAGYLAVKLWTRFYTPDVLLGVYTPDEFQDGNDIKDVNPEPIETKNKKGGVMDRLNNIPKPKAAKKVVKEVDVVREDEVEALSDDNSKDMIEDMALSDFTAAVIACDSLEAVQSVMVEIASSTTIQDKHKTTLRTVCKEQLQTLRGDK